MDCITMIGMPGCGKSTTGIVLAKTMGKVFLDTDLLIQEKEKRLLQEIIDQSGNIYFQRIEEEILRNLAQENTVIATGGSAVYYPEGMKNLKRMGVIVYIELPLGCIEERLHNIKTRGITMAPGESIRSLYERRKPLYEKYADLTISGEGKDVEKIIEEIMVEYKRWKKDC